MKRSETRILTTHTGSLPRPEGLVEMLGAVARGEPVDEAALAGAAREATAGVVRAQVEAGADVVNGGEQSRISFSTYVTQRMSGFGGGWTRRGHRDQNEFPSIARPRVVQIMRDVPMCVGPLSYDRLDVAERECDDLFSAVAESGAAHEELFMTAAAPGIITLTMKNGHYLTYEDYVFAVAEEMRKEYELIVSKGLDPATGLPRPGDGAARLVPGRAAGGVPGSGGAAHRGHQPRPAQHPPRAGAAARLLGQQRGAAPLRRAAGGHSAHHLPRQRRRAGDGDGQPAPRPRVQGLRSTAPARRYAAGGGRHRHQDQLRGTPGGGGRPAEAGSPSGGGRPDAGDGRHRLRLRHVGRLQPRRQGRVWLKLRSMREGADIASRELF